jgi:hypothetical protein
MKTLTTIFISLITLVSTANANENSSNIEITSTTVVTTTALTAGNNNNTVVLNWSAKNQANNSRFEIERSFYSNNFNMIATMQIAFANNSTNNFRISDNAAELTGRVIAYYRVKQIDTNGTISYSNTMVVNLQDAKNINAPSANAAQKTTSIRFAAAQNGNAVIKIQSLSGKTVAVKNTIISKGNNTVELENINGLSKGVYVSEVSVNGVVVDNQKVIVE